MARTRPPTFFDPALETRPAADRRRRLEERLRGTVAHAWAGAPGFRAALQRAGVAPDEVTGLDDLARLPITRKDELPALQAQSPPFGGLAAAATASLQRIFLSPGDIFDPQGPGQDYWRFQPALAAAGFGAGDVVLNTFSYHLTPAGFMFDGALRALGCVVVPTGPGQTELQVKIASRLGATGYVGTPSFLAALFAKAAEARLPLALAVACVTAEKLPESLRRELQDGHGVRVLQTYGTADVGMLAYECQEQAGMHLHPEVIVEIVDPASGAPAAPGEPGEVVATVFDDAYPLIRFATGDLSTFLPERPCPCGRTAPKLAGVLGRVGDGVKVKGMFVRAAQMDEVLAGFPEVARLQAVITRAANLDRLRYMVELVAGAPAAGLVERLAAALDERLKVRGEVEIVPAGSIPAGARKLDDRRVWE
jgi:phenylacetate-CoA ligase